MDGSQSDSDADTGPDRVEALREGADPPPIERPAAVVTVGDLDAVTKELIDVVRANDGEMSAAYASGYVDAARHYEQSLTHRLGLDHRD